MKSALSNLWKSAGAGLGKWLGISPSSAADEKASDRFDFLQYSRDCYEGERQEQHRLLQRVALVLAVMSLNANIFFKYLLILSLTSMPTVWDYFFLFPALLGMIAWLVAFYYLTRSLVYNFFYDYVANPQQLKEYFDHPGTDREEFQEKLAVQYAECATTNNLNNTTRKMHLYRAVCASLGCLAFLVFAVPGYIYYKGTRPERIFPIEIRNAAYSHSPMEDPKNEQVGEEDETQQDDKTKQRNSAGVPQKENDQGKQRQDGKTQNGRVEDGTMEKGKENQNQKPKVDSKPVQNKPEEENPTFPAKLQSKSDDSAKKQQR